MTQHGGALLVSAFQRSTIELLPTGPGLALDEHPYLKVGQRVCIRGGASDGVSGVLLAVNGDQSLIISVNLIQ